MDFTKRIIFHCDCNNFFASCESIDHPEYKTVPMAVAGDPETRTGIVVAKNDLAKKYGVKTTDTVWQAKQKCPGIIFVRPTHGLYSAVSKRVNAIYYEYTDLVEPASIDESYLDLTELPELKHMTPKEFADKLRARVKDEIGITISIGVSYNKTFAKMGSDYKKPDATTVISQDNYKEILWPLPISDMMYVGKASASRLIDLGITTIGAMAQLSPALLTSLLGKGVEQLWRNANGLDDDPIIRVQDRAEVKSVSRGHTFPHDLTTIDEIHDGMIPLVDEICSTLRQRSLKGSVIQVQIKAPSLEVVQRQTKLNHWTNIYSEIMNIAMELITSNWVIGQTHPIRAFTIGVTDLLPAAEAIEQISFLDNPLLTGKNDQEYERREKKEKVENTIDQIRARMGNNIIRFGSMSKKESE